MIRDASTSALTAAAEVLPNAERLLVDFLLPSLTVGGMEVVVSRLASRLRERGLDVRFTVTDAEGPVAEQLRADGFRVVHVIQPRLLASVRIGALRRHFTENEPHIVHVHSGAWVRGALAVQTLPMCGVLHTVHGLFVNERWQDTWAKRIAARNTDEIIAVSRSLADFVESKVGVSRSRIGVLPNGIDVDAFAPTPRTGALRQQLGVPADAIVIGTVARLEPIKNQQLLLHAFSGLASGSTNAHLVFVGDGELRQSLTCMADELGVGPRVHFAGRRAVDRALYAELDVFTLPSLLEGTSISLLEAMACGLPVVATAVGGTPDVLAGCPVESLAASEDREGLAALLRGFVESAERRRAAGEWLRRRVVEGYSEIAMVETYIACYRRIRERRLRQCSVAR